LISYGDIAPQNGNNQLSDFFGAILMWMYLNTIVFFLRVYYEFVVPFLPKKFIPTWKYLSCMMKSKNTWLTILGFLQLAMIGSIKHCFWTEDGEGEWYCDWSHIVTGLFKSAGAAVEHSAEHVAHHMAHQANGHGGNN